MGSLIGLPAGSPIYRYRVRAYTWVGNPGMTIKNPDLKTLGACTKSGGSGIAAYIVPSSSRPDTL